MKILLFFISVGALGFIGWRLEYWISGRAKQEAELQERLRIYASPRPGNIRSTSPSLANKQASTLTKQGNIRFAILPDVRAAGRKLTTVFHENSGNNKSRPSQTLPTKAQYEQPTQHSSADPIRSPAMQKVKRQ